MTEGMFFNIVRPSVQALGGFTGFFSPDRLRRWRVTGSSKQVKLKCAAQRYSRHEAATIHP